MDVKDRLSRYESAVGAANTALTLLALALATIGLTGINVNYSKYSQAAAKVEAAIYVENQKNKLATQVVMNKNAAKTSENETPYEKYKEMIERGEISRDDFKLDAAEAKQLAEAQRGEYVQFELQGLKLPISLQQAAIVWSALFTLLCFSVYAKKRQALALLAAYVAEARKTPPGMVEPVTKSPFWLAPLPRSGDAQGTASELSGALGWSGQEALHACLAGLAAVALWGLHVYVIGIGILVNDEIAQGLAGIGRWQAVALALAPAIFAGLSAVLTVRWFFMSGVPWASHATSGYALSRRRLLVDGAAFSGAVAAVGGACWSRYRDLIGRGVNVQAVLRATGNCTPWFRKRAPKPRVVASLKAGFYLNETLRKQDQNNWVRGLHYVRRDGRVMRLNPGATPRHLKPVDMAELERIVSVYGVSPQWKTSNAEVAAVDALKAGDVDAALKLLRIGIMIDLRRSAGGPVQAAVADAPMPGELGGARIERVEGPWHGTMPNGVPDDPAAHVGRIVQAVLAQVTGGDASPQMFRVLPPPRRCLPPDPGRREFILTLGPRPQREDAGGGTSVAVSLKSRPATARYPVSQREKRRGSSPHNYRLYDLLAGLAVRFSRQRALDEMIAEIGKVGIQDRRLLDRIKKWQAPASPWREKWTDKRPLPLRRAGAPRGSKTAEDVVRI